MKIFLTAVMIAVFGVAVLRLLRHSRYAVYFHWIDTPISAKQWLDMTHDQKVDHLFRTLVIGFKYYHEDPAVWMTDSGAEIERTIESAIQATDLSAKTRLNDATFGRLVRIATFDTVKQLLGSVKKGQQSGPKLTGTEWLSWPLEKKQELVADYLTLALMAIGHEKKVRPDEVSLGYIESIDKTAEQRPDDTRLNKFIANFINAMLKAVMEEFKREHVTK
jgi:hypothetical protein